MLSTQSIYASDTHLQVLCVFAALPMAALPEGKTPSDGNGSAAGKFTVSADELKDVLECPVCLKASCWKCIH